MSGLFGRPSNSVTPEIYSGIQISTSLLGQPIPYVAGRQRIPFNLMWYGNWFVSTSNAGGGKGGGGSGNLQYTYSTAWIGALCLGPIQGVFQIWHDKALETLTTENLALALGSSGQAVWSGFPSGTPTLQKIPYDHMAYVASSAYNLGSSASLPNLTFEVEGCVPGYSDAHSIFDADPSAVLPDYLLDPVRGALANYPGTPLIIGSTDAPLTGVTNSYQAYCMAMGLLTSPYEYTQRQATDFTAELLQCTNSDVFLSYGTLKIAPYCDAAVSATVAGTLFSYTPNLTPVYILGEDDYVSESETDPPVKLVIKALSDTYNMVNVEFLDRSDYYTAAPVPCSDEDDIAKHGPRLATSLTWHQITIAQVARTAGQLWLQRQLRERNTYEFKTRRDYSLLEPLIDFVGLNDVRLGLVNQVCQVEQVELGEDQYLTFTVREIPGVTRSTAQFNWSAAQGYFQNYATDPGAVQAPVMFQMPPLPQAESAGITIGIAACGQTANTAWLGCTVWCSVDGGTTYQYVGIIPEACRYGTITSNIGAVPDPDTISTLSIALANTTLQLSTAVTHADADEVQTPILVFGGTAAEVMSYGTAALVSAGNYNLSYLRRNLYGSANTAHSDTNEGGSGLPAQFVRIDGAIFEMAFDPGQCGQTVNFKFVSFNSWQRSGPQTLALATAYPYTIPAAVTLEGGLIAEGSAVSLGTSAYKAMGSASAWDSAVYSRESYTNGCCAQCYAAQIAAGGSDLMFGLTVNPTASVSYTNLAYAWQASAGNLNIYEGGTFIGAFGTYTPTDLLAITHDGKHVCYWHNGALIRSVPLTNQTFFLQLCFYDPGASVYGIDFSDQSSATTPYTLVPMSTNVAVSGTRATSVSGAAAWGTKNFQSKESYTGGAVASAAVNPVAAGALFFGFSEAPATGGAGGYGPILAGWYPKADSSDTQLLFNGALIGPTLSTPVAGDVFSVSYDGFYFYWYRNNTLIFQQYFPAASALYLFGDFYESGLNFLNLSFGPVNSSTPQQFIARGNVVVSDTNASKSVNDNLWTTGDAYSINGYNTCHVVFKPNQTTSNFMVGLVSGDPPATINYTGLNYALYCNGALDIYESGVSIGTFGTYATTDFLAITYDGATVKYWQNGTVLRSVSVAGLTLFADAVFYDAGALNSLEFGPSNMIPLADEAQINLNAVSLMSSVYNASFVSADTSISSPDSATVISLVVSSTGSPVSVDFSGTISYFTDVGATGTLTAQILRNGSALPSGGIFSTSPSAGETVFEVPFTMVATDAPGAGINTYSVLLTASGTSGKGAFISIGIRQSYLKYREIKR